RPLSRGDHVDPGLGQGGEDAGGDARCLRHAEPHHHERREAGADLDAVDLLTRDFPLERLLQTAARALGALLRDAETDRMLGRGPAGGAPWRRNTRAPPLRADGPAARRARRARYGGRRSAGPARPSRAIPRALPTRARAAWPSSPSRRVPAWRPGRRAPRRESRGPR